MSIICWIIVGLIGGVITSRFAVEPGNTLSIDVTIGILSAILCGALFSLGSGTSVTSLNLPSIILAAIGMIIILRVYCQSYGQTSEIILKKDL